MTPEVLKALESSIEHWRRLATGTAAEDESIWSDDCALCAKFSDKTPECKGCPVFEETKLDNCGFSARGALLLVGKSSSLFHAEAARMLAFLEGLRPYRRSRERLIEVLGSVNGDGLYHDGARTFERRKHLVQLSRLAATELTQPHKRLDHSTVQMLAEAVDSTEITTHLRDLFEDALHHLTTPEPEK